MRSAPFTIVIPGRRYACRVVGDTESEAADTAERILLQLRREDRVRPAQVDIDGAEFEAGKRLAAYFAAITVEPDLD